MWLFRSLFYIKFFIPYTRQAYVALCSAPDQLEELPTGRFQCNPTGMNSTIEDTGWKDFGWGWDMLSSRHHGASKWKYPAKG